MLASIGSMVVLPIVFFRLQGLSNSLPYGSSDRIVPERHLRGISGLVPGDCYPTHLRATGASFCFNVGRIVSAAGPFIGGTLVAFFGGIPTAACVMGASYLIGLIAVMFAAETRGKPLPE